MKKNYIKPSLQVVMIQQSDLIATSRVSLAFDFDDPEEEGCAD